MKSLKGFTLIEVLVALTIIGILMTFVGPYILDRPDQARKIKIKNDFLAIETAMELYKLDNGTYPNAANGLINLTRADNSIRRYLSVVPTDPWGNKYILEVEPGQTNFIIISTGPDGLRSNDNSGDDFSSEDLN